MVSRYWPRFPLSHRAGPYSGAKQKTTEETEQQSQLSAVPVLPQDKESQAVQLLHREFPQQLPIPARGGYRR